MAQCARCGLDGSKTRLLIAISDEGMIPICESCNIHEELPVIRRPTTYQLKEAERPTSVYNRLANMAKLNPTEHRQKLNIPEPKAKIFSPASTREATLREIVDKKYKEKQLQPVKKDTPLNLVENFHWAIKMARRARKLSVAQVAKEIGESEAVIEMVERGVLPEDDFRIINKLETFFKIKLLKDKENVRYFPNTSGLKKQEALKELPKEINFDDKNVRNLKIEDLKKIKEEKEIASGENGGDIDIEEDVEDSGENKEGNEGEQNKKGWKFWK
jgi:ribosome-binding protein aMBF1 (putative translation factor)